MCSITNDFHYPAELTATLTSPASEAEQELIRQIGLAFRVNPEAPFTQIIKIGQRDENYLIRIAYLLAQYEGRKTAKLLHRFGIKNQSVLVHLAKTCIESRGMAAKYIETIGITNEVILDRLARDCLVNMSIALLRENHRKITSALTCPFVFNRCRIDRVFVETFFSGFLPGREGFDDSLRELVLYAKEQFNPSLKLGEVLEEKEQMIHKCPNQALSRKLTYWLGVAILILHQSDEETISAFLETKLIDAYLTLRSPGIRVGLTKQMSEILCLPPERIKTLSNIKLIQEKRLRSVSPLIKMECLLLENAGIDGALLKNFERNIPGKIKSDDRKMAPLIELLKFLIESNEITLQTKQAIIEQFIPSQGWYGNEKLFVTYSKKIANFLTLFLFQETHALTPTNLDAESMVNTLLVEKLKIPNDQYYIDKFYRQLIHHPRLKGKFAVYAGKMARLHDPRPFMEVLNFVNAVIHDRFEEERKQIVHNEHMLHIQKQFPDICEQWMSLDRHVFSDPEDEWKVSFATTYIDFLCLGIDVLGNCLAIDGNPERTIATMEGILNPKHHYIMIESQSGIIAARLKLSIFPTAVGPACLIEDPYDNGNITNSHELLEKAAVKVGQILNIPVVSRGIMSYPWSKLKPFPHPLISLASEYCYEYVVDISERTVPFGKFTLDTELWVVGCVPASGSILDSSHTC